MIRPSRGADLLPELGRVVVADAVEVDQPGVRLGPLADDAALRGPQVDREAEAARDVRLAVDQPLARR